MSDAEPLETRTIMPAPADYCLRQSPRLQTGLLNFHSFQVELDSMLRTSAGPGNGGRLDRCPQCAPGVRVVGHRSLGAAGARGRRRFAGSVDTGCACWADLARNCFRGRHTCRKDRSCLHDRDLQKVLDTLIADRHSRLEDHSRSGRRGGLLSVDANRAEDLLRYASLAAARARYTRSSSSVLSFQPGMKKLLMRSHLLETEMGKSLERNEFSMLYQPKVDLKTGKCWAPRR